MANLEDYAIVIGIDTYPQLRRLRAAVSDATRFSEWLLSAAGGDIPPDNIRLIRSPATIAADAFDARPIQQDVDRALRDFGVTQNQRIGRRLYFYFAGHGLGPTFDDVGMLMADATMSNLRSNIGLHQYLVFLHDMGYFDEVVFILDCCRDPARTVVTGAPVFTLVPPAAPRQIEDFVVLAAEIGEKAFEPVAEVPGVADAEPRGVLTDAVLEGLAGEAANPDGFVTAFSLRDYLIRRVPEKVADLKLKQAPRIDRVPTREIVFRRVDPAALAPVTVRIIAPDGVGGELVVRDSKANEIERRSASDIEEAKAPWTPALLKNNRYEIEHTASQLVTILDLRTLQGPPYVYRFPPPA